jgi:hypothetical protein
MTDQEKDTTKQKKNTENTTEHFRQAEFAKLSNAIKNLNTTGKPYKQFIDRINSFDTTKITDNFDLQVKELLAELEDPQTLLSISQDLQAQDQQNGTNNFEAFRTSINTIAPEFDFDRKLANAQTNAKLAL